jgi:hypothetical protein
MFGVRKMYRFRSVRWLLAAVITTTMLGCATSYHDYEACGVPCHYCAPAPLPYTTYSSCVCHSQPASELIVAE